MPDKELTNAALVAKVLLVAVLGSLLGAAVIFLGPKETVVCDDTTWPNSMFGDAFGHTDGASFTGCDVPTRTTWALAIGSVLVPVAITITADLRKRRSTNA